MEAFGWLQFAQMGALPLIDSPYEFGFLAHPIVDGMGRALGSRHLVGLWGEHGGVRYVVWPQVSLRTVVTTFRVDGLVWMKTGGGSTWAVLEYDGKGHLAEKDKFRKATLGLEEIRISPYGRFF